EVFGRQGIRLNIQREIPQVESMLSGVPQQLGQALKRLFVVFVIASPVPCESVPFHLFHESAWGAIVRFSKESGLVLLQGYWARVIMLCLPSLVFFPYFPRVG